MELALKLLALQNERDHILFRINDVKNNDVGLHPTAEFRGLMAYYEQLNERIRTLVGQIMNGE